MSSGNLPPLGDFELLVLLAILRADGDAYGSTILRELHERDRVGRSRAGRCT